MSVIYHWFKLFFVCNSLTNKNYFMLPNLEWFTRMVPCLVYHEPIDNQDAVWYSIDNIVSKSFVEI